jgi:membrane protease YdiL (CAAX protease family)
MRSLLQRFGSGVGCSLLALFIIGAGGTLWGALVYANLRTTPSVPWALPALCAGLWLAWQYLGGRGWPRGTSARRKTLRRANRVSAPAFGWSLAAGLLAIVALAGFWITMFRLVPMTPNLVLPQRFTSSNLLIATIVAGASLLAPVTEEIGVRGYLQSVLERDFTPVTAVLVSSSVFALAHLTQGNAWPKLVFYFLVGVTFGALALLNDSILPVLPVHAAGDVVFFLLIWPRDAGRSLVWAHGADAWFWIHVAQAIGFAAAAVWTFRRISRASRSSFNADQVDADSVSGRGGQWTVARQQDRVQ